MFLVHKNNIHFWMHFAMCLTGYSLVNMWNNFPAHFQQASYICIGTILQDPHSKKCLSITSDIAQN